MAYPTVPDKILTLLLRAESIFLSANGATSDILEREIDTINTSLKSISELFCRNHNVSLAFLADRSLPIAVKMESLRKAILVLQNIGAVSIEDQPMIRTGQRYKVVKGYRRDGVNLLPLGEVVEFVSQGQTSRDGDHRITLRLVRSGELLDIEFNYDVEPIKLELFLKPI